MSARRPSLLGALAAAVLLAVPAAATAAQPHSLTEARGSTFPDRTLVLGLDPPRPRGPHRGAGARERPAGIRRRVAAAGAAGSKSFGVVLVIDASESMHGPAIAGAMAAARAVAAQRLPNQELAVVFFNRTARVALPFTTDAAAIAHALAAPPPLATGTHVYDAIGGALALVKREQLASASVLVLSDGADTGSRADRSSTVTLARAAHVACSASACARPSTTRTRSAGSPARAPAATPRPTHPRVSPPSSAGSERAWRTSTCSVTARSPAPERGCTSRCGWRRAGPGVDGLRHAAAPAHRRAASTTRAPSTASGCRARPSSRWRSRAPCSWPWS